MISYMIYDIYICMYIYYDFIYDNESPVQYSQSLSLEHDYIQLVVLIPLYVHDPTIFI